MRDRIAERITPSDIRVLPRSIFDGTSNSRIALLRDTKLEAIQILPLSTLRRIRKKIKYGMRYRRTYASSRRHGVHFEASRKRERTRRTTPRPDPS